MQTLHANVHWLVLIHSKAIGLPSVIPIRQGNSPDEASEFPADERELGLSMDIDLMI